MTVEVPWPVRGSSRRSEVVVPVMRGESHAVVQRAGRVVVRLDLEPGGGRALTAQFMPNSPALEKRMTDAGNAAGHEGKMNTWPIDLLQGGDVYVADGFGKADGGTLIGGTLASEIYEKSHNGVVFDGTVRDLEELEAIKGFNAYVRDWHPSYLEDVMLTGLNTTTRIGEAVVLPGDVVLAKREGVVFIPAQLADDLAKNVK